MDGSVRWALYFHRPPFDILHSVRSLALLSCLRPEELGLDDFGAKSAYFPRQLKSLSAVSHAQSKAVDVDTKQIVGPIPYFEESMAWYRSHLPDEGKMGRRIVHGDYKMDNLVFHKTEPRVIGMLDWYGTFKFIFFEY